MFHVIGTSLNNNIVERFSYSQFKKIVRLFLIPPRTRVRALLPERLLKRQLN